MLTGESYHPLVGDIAGGADDDCAAVAAIPENSRTIQTLARLRDERTVLNYNESDSIIKSNLTDGILHLPVRIR